MSGERCPRCKSTNITGRAFDTRLGDEDQERYCYDCHHFEQRLRSVGGVSWYPPEPMTPPHRGLSADGVERALLDEIYAKLEDDAPRSIYADWLIERGDPLGTFIALQLARHRERAPEPYHEEQRLLDEHWAAWIGMPSAVLAPRMLGFERGFWLECDHDITRPELDAPEIVESRSWATVQDVTVGRSPVERSALLVKTRDSLRAITIQSAPAIDELARVATPFPRVERLVIDVDIRPPPVLPAFRGLPALRSLVVQCTWPALAWVDRLAATAVPDVEIACRPAIAQVQQLIDLASPTALARLAIRGPTSTTFRAERDSDDTFLVRSVDVGWISDPVDELRHVQGWLSELGDRVDRGVKVRMPDFTPDLARYADSLGLRLVALPSARRRFAARPREIR
ncbi:MAG TPA: TIGR02996 domain-containing protein [Kofleriaceae bacterium]|nr:TIGR02996 domain-containing protein [Kofleriaceae bacterium]